MKSLLAFTRHASGDGYENYHQGPHRLEACLPDSAALLNHREHLTEHANH